MKLSEVRSDEARKELRASNLAELEMVFEQEMPVTCNMGSDISSITVEMIEQNTKCGHDFKVHPKQTSPNSASNFPTENTIPIVENLNFRNYENVGGTATATSSSQLYHSYANPISNGAHVTKFPIVDPTLMCAPLNSSDALNANHRYIQEQESKTTGLIVDLGSNDRKGSFNCKEDPELGQNEISNVDKLYPLGTSAGVGPSLDSGVNSDSKMSLNEKENHSMNETTILLFNAGDRSTQPESTKVRHDVEYDTRVKESLTNGHHPDDENQGLEGRRGRESTPPQSCPQSQREESLWESNSPKSVGQRRVQCVRAAWVVVVVIIAAAVFVVASYLGGMENTEEAPISIESIDPTDSNTTYLDKARLGGPSHPSSPITSSSKSSTPTASSPMTSPPTTSTPTKISPTTSTPTTSLPMTSPPTSSPELNIVGRLYEIASEIIIKRNVSAQGSLGHGGCSWSEKCIKNKNIMSKREGSITIHQQALLRCVSEDYLLGKLLKNNYFNQGILLDEDVVIQCYIINIIGLSLGMESWKNNDGWSSSAVKNYECEGSECKNECSWYGIQCFDVKSRFLLNQDVPLVISIDLNNNALNGTLPPEIWKLNLTALKLYDNVFDGNLTGIVESRNLEDLWLQNSGMKGRLSGRIPSEIGLLTNMKKLYLGNNELEGSIPTEIENLQDIKVFSVFENKLSGPFPKLQNCTLLEKIYLDGNELTGSIPQDFGFPLNDLLEDFRVNNNNLYGSFPRSFQNMNKLKILYIDNNQFTGHIPAVRDWSNMKQFDASKNKFSGTIPPDIFETPKLKSINLSGNDINSSIPDNICDNENSRKLQKIDFSSNSIQGTIPDSLKNCADLGTLFINGNKLEGPIPHFFGNFTKLLYLYLNDNKFNGTVPQTLSSASKLFRINISKNNLTGEIDELLCDSTDEIIVDCQKVDCSCCNCSRRT